MTDIEFSRIYEILRKTFLFQNLCPKESDKHTPFLAQCVFCRYDAGSTIQNTQFPLLGIAVLLSGHAEVRSSLSNASVCLRSLQPGSVFGVAMLYTENRQYETAICAATDCEILLLPEECIKRLIRANPQIAENYIRFLSDRICFLNQKITAFTAGSAEAKLSVYLSSLCSDADGYISLPTSLSALAGSLGMGRASLYRALDKLEVDGYIARNGKQIRILNPKALQNSYRHETNSHY